MNEKKIVGIATVGIMLAAMIAIVTPVSADTIYSSMYTGQTKEIWLDEGNTMEVTYFPLETGYKELKMWHASPGNWHRVAFCSLYGTSNWGQTWNHFLDTHAGYYWPTTHILYSGSSNIGYKIVCKNHNANPTLLMRLRAT